VWRSVIGLLAEKSGYGELNRENENGFERCMLRQVVMLGLVTV
jgi:hypothetical protein